LAGAASAAMLLLAACTHDPYVNATNTTPSGEWRIERQIDASPARRSRASS
jgi:hypothetical protein